jgi:hypothetical protein
MGHNRKRGVCGARGNLPSPELQSCLWPVMALGTLKSEWLTLDQPQPHPVHRTNLYFRNYKKLQIVFPLSVLNSRPLALSTWANVCLLSFTLNPVARNCNSTLPLLSPAWILGMLQIKEWQVLTTFNQCFGLRCANPNTETQDIWKNKPTWLLQK